MTPLFLWHQEYLIQCSEDWVLTTSTLGCLLGLGAGRASLSLSLTQRKCSVPFLSYLYCCFFPYSLQFLNNAEFRRNSSLTIRWPELLQFVRTESSISSGTDGRKPLPSEEGTDLLGGCTDPQVDGLNSILSAGITSIDAFHGFVGLPWWATIGLVGFGVRTAMLPVALKSMKASAALLPLWRRARQESMIGQRGMISDKESKWHFSRKIFCWTYASILRNMGENIDLVNHSLVHEHCFIKG